MAQDKANEEKAKMELTARITLPDGTIVERTVTEDALPSSEFDFSDLDKFLTTFDDYERNVVAARNQLAQDVSDAYMSEMSTKGLEEKGSGEPLSKPRIVESEIGQLGVVFCGAVVSVLKPKQQVLSHWMNDVMLNEALCGSYQESVDRINKFLHRSGATAISKTTLKDRATTVGNKLSAQYKVQSDNILEKYHF